MTTRKIEMFNVRLYTTTSSTKLQIVDNNFGSIIVLVERIGNYYNILLLVFHQCRGYSTRKRMILNTM
jgi:hypothetical protein